MPKRSYKPEEIVAKLAKQAQEFRLAAAQFDDPSAPQTVAINQRARKAPVVGTESD